MNEISKTGKKVLVLAYTKEDVIRSLPLIREFEKNGSKAVVLGLDFYSWIELRNRNIQYKTPADYLDRGVCAKIDIEAISLAREWYKPINDKITHHGISIGEMQEYNFAFLFMDALRDIETAKSLIEVEKPSEILLSKKIPLFNANAVRYEALPSAMMQVAKLKEIPISYSGSNSDYESDKNKRVSIFRNMVIGTLYQVKKLREKLRLRLKVKWHSRRKHRIVFVDIPPETLQKIKIELEKNQENVIINLSTRMTLKREKISSNKVKEMMEILKDLECNEQFRKTLLYDDIPLIEILHDRFRKFFSYELLVLVNYIEETEKFIKKAKPDIVITMEDITPVYRVITRVCRANRIPTLVIQHGIQSADMKGFHVMPVEADKQAVWGNISKKWAVERGKAPETQVVTGNPRYDLVDAIDKKSEQKKPWIYDKLGLVPGKGIVVIATTWYCGVSSCYVPEEVEVFIWKTLEAMREFSEKQVVIKLHPSYHSEYEKIAHAVMNELQINNVVITEHFLWELLSICDLSIIDFSTVGLEAMLFDKPVITFDPMRTLELNSYAGTGAVLEVYEEKDLVPAIKAALYDKKVQERLAEARKKFVYEYAYLRDGKAALRVAKLIEQMIKEKTSS